MSLNIRTSPEVGVQVFSPLQKNLAVTKLYTKQTLQTLSHKFAKFPSQPGSVLKFTHDFCPQLCSDLHTLPRRSPRLPTTPSPQVENFCYAQHNLFFLANFSKTSTLFENCKPKPLTISETTTPQHKSKWYVFREMMEVYMVILSQWFARGML